MSIMETFYLLFKGDNTDLKAKAKEVENTTNQLQKNVNKALTSVRGDFSSAAQSLLQFVSASYAAYTIIHKTLAASEFVSNLSQTASLLRINASELDAWGNAVQYAGGSAEGFQRSLEGLSKHFGTTPATALKLFPRLADVFHRLGNFRAQYYGKQLGLDQNTILFLQQGRREVEATLSRIKELSIVREKDIEVSNKYKLAQFELSLAFRSVFLEINQIVLPLLTKFEEKFTRLTQYILYHKELIKGALIGIGVAATLMLAPFIVAQAPLIALYALLAGVVGLIALAYEDYQVFLRGGDSVTGDLIKKWSQVKEQLKEIFEVFKKLLSLDFSILKEVFHVLNPISHIQDIANLIRDKINFSDNTPIATAGANSFTKQMFNRNDSINTGDIIINTQATDAAGIQNSFKQELNKHFFQANNQFANGQAY